MASDCITQGSKYEALKWSDLQSSVPVVGEKTLVVPSGTCCDIAFPFLLSCIGFMLLPVLAVAHQENYDIDMHSHGGYVLSLRHLART